MAQQEETRKGPWTEQEDAQLGFYVNMFGDRRWDFVAKVSGLKRTGKSCRLRWVNYLHPDLKHGKMTPHEERLVLELHSKWGNRWSRIARKLPGRTDNEIKNYWRTHMRKKAQQDRKKNNLSTSSSSSSTSLSNNSNSSTSSSKGNSPVPVAETKERNFYDTGGVDGGPATGPEEMTTNRSYTLDEIWKDIELPEDNYYVNKPILDHGFISEAEESYFSGQTMVPSPVWNVSLWTTAEEEEEEEHKMFPPKNNTSIISDHQFYSFY